MKKILLLIVLSLGMITDDFLVFEYTCNYPELGPKFYGFPFVQETNTTWVNSMSGEIYILGFIGNLIIWTLIFGIVFQLLKRIRNSIGFKVFVTVLMLYALFFSCVYFSIIDWRFSYSHDDFKVHYYQSKPDCKPIFKFLK